MAEFCLECFNKINKKNYSRSEVGLSWSEYLCEECCEYKRVVIYKHPKIFFSSNKSKETGLQIFLNEIKRMFSGYYKSK